MYLLDIQDPPGQPNSFLHSCCGCPTADESSQCHNTHKTTLNSKSNTSFRPHVLNYQTMWSSGSCHITNESNVDSKFVVTRLSIPYDYTSKSMGKTITLGATWRWWTAHARKYRISVFLLPRRTDCPDSQCSGWSFAITTVWKHRKDRLLCCMQYSSYAQSGE